MTPLSNDHRSTRVLGTRYLDWQNGPQNSGLRLDEIFRLG
jgi:hypothetical protein